MRIVVNDIAASVGGALSILKDFYNNIKENDKENEWIFLLSSRHIEETENIKVVTLPEIKASWIKRLYFDLVSGKSFISLLSADMVFSLQNIITFGLKIPQAVYIHQSIPFQKTKKFSFLKSDERKLAIIQRLIGRIIRYSALKADIIIVQTKWMRDSIIELLKIDDTRIFDILPNTENFTPYRKTSIFNEKSFFYPTSEEVYKNCDCIYKACRLLNEAMIDEFEVKITLQHSDKQRNIKFIGKISREQVFDEYNTSTLLFPSYIETIGLPLMEARKMGTVVLASDCAFSREVLEGYDNAYFFNPFSPEELAGLMKKVINGQIVRKNIASENIIHRNSWSDVREVIVELAKARVSH